MINGVRDPHHDGSELYLDDPEPDLGQTVTVRLRVPGGARAVYLRTVVDGEPEIREAVAEKPCAGKGRPSWAGSGLGTETWYRASFPLHNPLTTYRFLVDGPGGPTWINGAGPHHRDVPDAFDFRVGAYAGAPAWSRGGVAYQIFPDRFARGKGGPRSTDPAAGPGLPDWAAPTAWNTPPAGHGPLAGAQLYGGNLAGVAEHLDHVAALGADIVYLTPFFPAGSSHRYDAQTFDHVDPLLGGDEALVDLSRSVHARGMHLVGDITTNHTGATHEWFRAAVADPRAPEADFYYFTRHPDEYAHWLQARSLPKLRWGSAELVRRFLDGPDSVVGRWLGPPYELDGWRVDVANMTGRYGAEDLTGDVARRMRATIDVIRPHGLLLAEHFHDPSGDLTGAGWQGTMNYSAFTRPVWTWLSTPGTGHRYLGLPVEVPHWGGDSMVATMREFAAQSPWSVVTGNWNNLGSHDTARPRTLLGARGQELAAVLLFTYVGTPMIFAGDEWGLEGENGESARVSMPWDDPARQDERTFAVYRDLIALRRRHRALRDGGLRWVLAAGDAVGYLRETRDEALLVVVARGPWSGLRLPWPSGDVERLWGDLEAVGVAGSGSDGAGGSGGVAVAGDGPGAGVWRLG